jgi:serine/threonine-protein kinase
MTMTLRELFDLASAVPAAERAAWLEVHCPDPALRAQLEALLAADATRTTSAPPDPLALARDIGTATRTLPPGARIGPYTLDQPLGEGGSSTVYRAHRDLDGIRQTVALKLLRRGLDAPDARRQFDRERQALAQLQHPHIAQFIDGGITTDGAGWLALEFVDGAPIHTYARQQRLDFRRRLALMVDVARAVAAAHRSLIVHRDLKPGNVLVTADGHVKLLDFGIAKLLGDAPEPDRTVTRAFTPAYAAPEQRDGGPITTATDVYALGIILGELVTGQRLTDGGTATPSSRITDDTDPGALPAEPKLTRRLVRGDLDNILMKALDDEPERRYVTAAAFADDLERLLAGQPVSAHPPSGWYRAQKFIQRHRGGVAITALLSLAVLVSLAVALWQTREAERQAQIAEMNADFLLSVFESAEHGRAASERPTIDDLVDSARVRLESDDSVSPSMRGRFLAALAVVANTQVDDAQLDLARASLAAFDEAGDRESGWRLSAEVKYAEALAKKDAAAGLEAFAVLMPRLRTLHNRLTLNGIVAYITATTAQSKREQTLALIDEWRALEAAIVDPEDDDAIMRQTQVATQLLTLEQYDDALPMIDAIERHYTETQAPPDIVYAQLLEYRGMLRNMRGDTVGAVESLTRSMELRRELFGARSTRVASSLRNLAALNGELGRFDLALEQVGEAQSIHAELGERDDGLIHAYTVEASVSARAGRFEQSLAAVENGLALCAEEHLKNDATCIDLWRVKADSNGRLGRWDEAEAAIVQGMALARTLAGEGLPFARLLALDAVRLLEQGRPADSLTAIDRALAILGEKQQARSAAAVSMLLARTRALLALGRAEEAVTQIDDARAIIAGALANNPERLKPALVLRAIALARAGRDAEAREVAREAAALEAPNAFIRDADRAAFEALLTP